MLSSLLKDEIKRRGISIREAGREIGISPTTINRILEGKQTSFGPELLVSNWLNIDRAEKIENNKQWEISVSEILIMLLKRNPLLAQEFQSAINALQFGQIETEDLEDILTYMTYRLSMAKGRVHDTGSSGHESSKTDLSKEKVDNA